MRHLSATVHDRRIYIYCEIFYSLPFSLIAYLSPYTFQRTSALSLSDCDTQSAKPGPNGSYRAPRSHTRPHDDEYCAISPDTPHARGALLYLCARALSLLFSLPFVLRWSGQRVAKVEANHHAITAPGTAGTPTCSQKAATAFCRPGAFTTAVPLLQNQQSSSCVPRKKRASLSLSPFPALFSPNHRRADRSSDYWHPGNPSRGIAAIPPPIEGRGRHALNPRRQLPRVDTTLPGMRMVEKKYILG